MVRLSSDVFLSLVAQGGGPRPRRLRGAGGFCAPYCAHCHVGPRTTSFLAGRIQPPLCAAPRAQPGRVVALELRHGEVQKTPEGQVDNLHRRALEALKVSRRLHENHPSVVDALWSKMQPLGMTAEKFRKLVATALSAQAQAVKDRKANASTDEMVKVENLKDEVSAAPSTGVVDVVAPLADRVKLIGNLGVAALRDKWPPSISPAIMSSANIRAMRDPQQLSQTSLLRYLEFATG